jgi:hypothetical protein
VEYPLQTVPGAQTSLHAAGSAEKKSEIAAGNGASAKMIGGSALKVGGAACINFSGEYFPAPSSNQAEDSLHHAVKITTISGSFFFHRCA